MGGLSFQFEELLAGASALDGIVRELAAVEAEADAVRRALIPYQSHRIPAAAMRLSRSGRNPDFRRVRTELEGLASDVRASHREYDSRKRGTR